MDILNSEMYREVLSAFIADETDTVSHPLGNGNINETYLVRNQEKRFVLQKINSSVFPEPVVLARNFLEVTRHISIRSKVSGITFQCPQLIPAKNGEPVYRDSQGGYWRAQTFIEHLHCDGAATTDLATELGRTLALFHVLTDDLDVENVGVPLPGFHVTSNYLKKFDETMSCLKGAAEKDDPIVLECLEYVDRYRYDADLLLNMKEHGRLRERIIHGDPKLDNIIVSPEGAVVGMFDLDTVGAGLIHYDIGDCLRSVCNRSGENTSLSTEITFDIEICKAVLTGYLAVAGEHLTEDEVSVIYDSIRIISLELGIRFLTDHLQGDLYFNVEKKGDNLRKAYIQLRLVESIVAQENMIQSCIAGLMTKKT